MSKDSSRVVVAGPACGLIVPAFTLPSANHSLVRVRFYRQRQPVLLAFMHEGTCACCIQWLRSLASGAARAPETGAAILAVFPGRVAEIEPLALDLPGVIPLADEGGHVTSMYLPTSHFAAPDVEAHPVGLFAIDRFGSLLARWVGSEADALPLYGTAARSIEAAELCDCGCGAPAWPVESEQYTES